MKRVIDNAKLKNNNPIGNLNKMVRSIYAYKSSMNFQNKMKIINNQSKSKFLQSCKLANKLPLNPLHLFYTPYITFF